MSVTRAFTPGIVAAVTLVADVGGQPNNSAAPLRLEWQRLADLPEPVGLKGMYGGSSEGQVLLAGGSNFPVPQREGGTKRFHRGIYLRPADADATTPWVKAALELPKGLGEGASLTTAFGVVAVGGHDGTGPVASVFALRWNRSSGRVEQAMLPDLPEPVANPAAAQLDGWLYVAGGERRAGALGTFWRIDLARAISDPATVRWEVLPGWPGRPRFGGVLVPVTSGNGDALLWGGGVHGPARSEADYLRDTFVYHPVLRAWRPAAPMPRGAVLASTLRRDAHRVLVLGGSDGHDFERMKELGERYRIPDDVLLYDALADRWSVVGAMPLGVVGAAVVPVGNGWLLAGGEYSPGLRTPRVDRLTVLPVPEAETPSGKPAR